MSKLPGRFNHDLGRGPGWSKLAGSHRRPGIRRMLEQHDVFGLWGRGVQLLIDAVTMALTGQVKIYANLLCDVGIRYPGVFGVTAP